MRTQYRSGIILFMVIWLLSGCSEGQGPTPDAAEDTAFEGPAIGNQQIELPAGIMVGDPVRNAQRQALYGDLHVHTAYSFDAFAFGTIATPYDGYRYARGEAIRHPAGFMVQLSAPLDFYAITDHAMFLGAVKAAADTSTAFSRLDQNKPIHNLNAADTLSFDSIPLRGKTFSTFLANSVQGVQDGTIDVAEVNQIAQAAWRDIINAAEQYNEPGVFTTLVGYEYTASTTDRGNLHRNVIFRSADKLPVQPFSRYNSTNPEDLWDWMDSLRDQGIETLAIPHNSNGSNGQMFKLVDWAGNPLDDSYALQRMRNEPLVEITQIKGTSETHPALSPNDEWADFEIMPYRVATTLDSEPAGSYVRDALLRGLAFEDQGTANPYRFGFAGASDTHNAAASVEEDSYFSKVGLLDGEPALRGSVPLDEEFEALVRGAGRQEVVATEQGNYTKGAYETWSAAGLTGVWADENTREAIYDAFRRKETFATSGPRIGIRFFAAADFTPAILEKTDLLAEAYRRGAAMGSDLLLSAGEAPSFLVMATRDPRSAPLQRVQIIKGWTEAGEHHEQVFDVACSHGGTPDSTTHRCPGNGASVDLTDCSYSADVGAGELKAVWQDPDYDPAHRAFYYARVLENPTCRWSTWDAIRAGVAPREGMHATIQERAWSSPVWVTHD